MTVVPFREPQNDPSKQDEGTDLSGADLKMTLIEKEERIIKLLKQNSDLSERIKGLEKVLNEIVHSKSWSITAPIRKLSELKRNLFPLFRWARYSFSISPKNQIGDLGSNRYEILGPTPYFILTSESGYPSGWVSFSARFSSPARHTHFYLYWDLGRGFQDSQRSLIPVTENQSEYHLFKLPIGIKGIRLDPFDASGEFELSQITLRELGKLQVIWSILKKQIRYALFNPKFFLSKLKKALVVFREGGFGALKVRLLSNQYTNDYQEWVSKYDTLTDQDRDQIRSHIDKFPLKPCISIVMPTYNTEERWLRAAIESVLSQLYPNWELCIADDASTEPHVLRVLQEYSTRDRRIKTVIRSKNGHISEASNSALELATGEFVALLDHDDALSEHALYMVVNEINSYPEAKLIYSDEDKLTSYDMRFNPYFKSDWNPELIHSQNYICHLGVYRTEIVKKIGGFRKGYEGSQDWDLALRVIDEISEKEIRHIPHILYHWRVIEGSTAQSSGFKPYALKTGAQAVSDHLARNGKKGRVEILEDIAHYRVRYDLGEYRPMVSIIIPTKDRVDILSRCIGTILEKTLYKNYEIIVVDNGSVDPETLTYFKTISRLQNVRVITDSRPFNFSALNNSAVKVAKGEVLGFLNNDLEVIAGDWLTEMVSILQFSENAVVGARLLYPNNLLQHGGIIMGIGGVAGHNHKGQTRYNPGYFNRAILRQNLSGVTAACMLVKREVFEGIGGFNEQELAVAFNDVDFCLRVRRGGYKIIYTPYAELYHHESVSRGYENTPDKFNRFESEAKYMKEYWGDALRNDPYYNPNLTLLSEDFAFSFPPRVSKPWKH